MKALITLLFLVCVAMGQDSNKGNLLPFGRTQISDTSHNLLTVKSFVQLYDEYSKECWNDSTEVGYDLVVVNGRFVVDKKHYTHSTYPTLPGFIEFLKRKGNQND